MTQRTEASNAVYIIGIYFGLDGEDGVAYREYGQEHLIPFSQLHPDHWLLIQNPKLAAYMERIKESQSTDQYRG